MLEATLVNALLAGTAYALHTVNRSGAFTGWALGTVVYAASGPRGFALLMVFFVLGSAATRLGYRKKLSAKIAQEEGGARSWRNAVANAGAPALLALASALTPHRELFLIGLVGALATATGDTLSSEVGKAYGKKTFLLTTLGPVPPGTVGAVSLEGTVAGIIGCLVLTGAATLLNVARVEAFPWIAAAAIFGFMVEGYLGALLETRGFLNNDQVNFANTLLGAGAAMLLVRAFA